MNAFDTSNSPTTEDDLVLFSSNVTNSIWKHPLNISTFLSIDFHLFFFSIQPEYGISLGFLGNDEMVIDIWSSDPAAVETDMNALLEFSLELEDDA